MPPSQVPGQGQLVEVRQQQYVVTDVVQSALPLSCLSTGDGQPQHLISIEYDTLGEELRVVWKLEPGARVREQSMLPEPFSKIMVLAEFILRP